MLYEEAYIVKYALFCMVTNSCDTQKSLALEPHNFGFWNDA
jgi:hypothetical protein